LNTRMLMTSSPVINGYAEHKGMKKHRTELIGSI